MEEAPVVVDLNVLLASILKPLGYTSSHLIQLYMKGRRLHIPAYTREEFERVAAEIARRKGLNPRTLTSRFNSILNLLKEVRVEEYREYIKEAEELVNDPKDAPYVALALHLAGKHGKAVILTCNQEDYKTGELEGRNIIVARPGDPRITVQK